MLYASEVLSDTACWVQNFAFLISYNLIRPCFNSDIINSIPLRKQLHRMYKTTDLDTDYHKFSDSRNNCKTLIDSAYNSFVVKIENCLTRYPRRFW